MHPVVKETRDQIEGMLEEVTELLVRVQSGDLSEEVRSRLLDQKLEAKRFARKVRYFIEKKWAGAEDWMITKLAEIITVCEIALAEFKMVTNSFQAAFAD